MPKSITRNLSQGGIVTFIVFEATASHKRIYKIISSVDLWANGFTTLSGKVENSETLDSIADKWMPVIEDVLYGSIR